MFLFILTILSTVVSLRFRRRGFGFWRNFWNPAALLVVLITFSEGRSHRDVSYFFRRERTLDPRLPPAPVHSEQSENYSFPQHNPSASPAFFLILRIASFQCKLAVGYHVIASCLIVKNACSCHWPRTICFVLLFFFTKTFRYWCICQVDANKSCKCKVEVFLFLASYILNWGELS